MKKILISSLASLCLILSVKSVEAIEYRPYKNLSYKEKYNLVQESKKSKSEQLSEALFELAITIKDGSGYPAPNLYRAQNYFLEAANLGHGDAQYFMGLYHKNGWGKYKKNALAATSWFKKSAQSNFHHSAAALNQLAVIQYDKGNYDEATTIWKKCLEKNVGTVYQCSINLGASFIDGKGVNKDYEEALSLLESGLKSKYAEQNYKNYAEKKIELIPDNVKKSFAKENNTSYSATKFGETIKYKNLQGNPQLNWPLLVPSTKELVDWTFLKNGQGAPDLKVYDKNLQNSRIISFPNTPNNPVLWRQFSPDFSKVAFIYSVNEYQNKAQFVIYELKYNNNKLNIGNKLYGDGGIIGANFFKGYQGISHSLEWISNFSLKKTKIVRNFGNTTTYLNLKSDGTTVESRVPVNLKDEDGSLTRSYGEYHISESGDYVLTEGKRGNLKVLELWERQNNSIWDYKYKKSIKVDDQSSVFSITKNRFLTIEPGKLLVYDLSSGNKLYSYDLNELDLKKPVVASIDYQFNRLLLQEEKTKKYVLISAYNKPVYSKIDLSGFNQYIKRIHATFDNKILLSMDTRPRSFKLLQDIDFKSKNYRVYNLSDSIATFKNECDSQNYQLVSMETEKLIDSGNDELSVLMLNVNSSIKSGNYKRANETLTKLWSLNSDYINKPDKIDNISRSTFNCGLTRSDYINYGKYFDQQKKYNQLIKNMEWFRKFSDFYSVPYNIRANLHIQKYAEQGKPVYNEIAQISLLYTKAFYFTGKYNELFEHLNFINRIFSPKVVSFPDVYGEAFYYAYLAAKNMKKARLAEKYLYASCELNFQEACSILN